VFAGFVPSHDPTIKVLAVALSVGILADAFVVRMLLVPAAMSLLGARAWALPHWLRWLPELDVEGSSLPRTGAQQDGVGVPPDLELSHSGGR
jgi:RND superfamily putative drug exporter